MSSSPVHQSKIVEMRQYVLAPGARNEFAEIFANVLTPAQEDVGMSILGQFADLDRENVFVWFRGFSDMQARARALPTFYFGPTWRRERTRVNDMIVDSDNVFLLKPHESGVLGLVPTEAFRLFHVELKEVAPACTAPYLDEYVAKVAPILAHHGAALTSVLQTLHAENNFPQLPVRTDVNVAVTITAYADASHATEISQNAEYTRAKAALDADYPAPLSTTLRLTQPL